MGTTNTAPRTKTTDIMEISSLLDGKVEFSEIKFSQCIMGDEHGKSINSMHFVKQAYGVYFYTDKYALESIINPQNRKPLPTLVGVAGSRHLFEIK